MLDCYDNTIKGHPMTEHKEVTMWDRVELKTKGREAFKANYWRCVLVSFILTLLAGGTSAATSSKSQEQVKSQDLSNLDPHVLMAITLAIIGIVLVSIAISIVFKIFLWNPLEVGCFQFMKRNLNNPDTSLDTIKEGFTDYSHTFGTLLLRDVFLALWFMLLFIPGMIKSYSYRMVPYILRDEPDLSASEVITRSREMMDGHKWNAFVLDLSFLGWHLLGIITCGLVEVFWTAPYVYSTNAALYEAIRDGR